MQELIQEYQESRQILRNQIRQLRQKVFECDDDVELTDLKHDISMMNSMVRDMTESISLMRNPKYELRGKRKVVTMDPFEMSGLSITDNRDPGNESDMRKQIREAYWETIEKNLGFLTTKQRSTLERWIKQKKTISEIAAEDGVSRQSVWERIFGNRSHPGALRKLRDGLVIGENKQYEKQQA
ncbi:hypothetical protein ACTFSJ_27630 [Bacillus cereus group sp. MYBK12-2]|uniref:hypothetical protein n=1 Tax=Bacillus cereus group sp. MYBK12-2 TaxID=3450689 RepID=UPI0032F284A0|nr:hypothetical protein [Bacillus pacificus]HDR7653552.1 hypothetical protein [Bacillus pacificus]